MSSGRVYAVVTGDVVASSRMSQETRALVISGLKEALGGIERHWPQAAFGPFEIHRGDSFQGALTRPAMALRVSLWIRAWLRQIAPQGQPAGRSSLGADARVSIGIGEADQFTRVAEGQGEAFWRSGKALESMRGKERLAVRTPWADFDETMKVETALVDALLHRWSKGQAQVVCCLIRGLKGREAALELGITEAAVAQRAGQAGWWALDRTLLRFESVVQERTGAGSTGGSGAC